MAAKSSVKSKLYKSRSKKLVDFANLHKLSKKLKKLGKKIVFTTGSFEFITPGHCRYIAEAKARGDVLVVGVGTDQSIKRMKGEEFPLIPEDIRAEVVSYLKSVDYITVVDEDRPHAALILLQPDVFYTSEDAWEDGTRNEQDRAVVKMYGGNIIVRKKEEPYFGTSALIDRIADIRVIQILEGYLKEKIPDVAFESISSLRPVDFGKQVPNTKNALDISNLILNASELVNLLSEKRKSGKNVALVAGSYDLLHAGHARFIEKAGLHGDILVVAIPSDASVKKSKGVGRPVISEHSRAYSLAYLDPVDYVVIFDDDTVLQTLKELKPSVFYTVKEDWNKGYKTSPEYKAVVENGGKVVLGDRESPSISASAIIDKAAKRRVNQIFRACMDEERYAKIMKEKSRLNGK